jgi:ABC-type antimicrobial peptide transport system permease subunit
LTTFAGLAVFLAGLGVYGLMSFVVKARTREFGVRLALGADKRHLAVFVARQGLVWLVAGTVIGLAMTLAVSRTLEGLLFGVESIDPLTLTGAVILLISVGCVASLIPVYRATRTDPLSALRFE